MPRTGVVDSRWCLGHGMRLVITNTIAKKHNQFIGCMKAETQDEQLKKLGFWYKKIKK